MKYIIAVFALATLGACGASSGTSVSTMDAPTVEAPTLDTASVAAPTAPSAPVATTFAGMLNNVRASNGAASVTYDARLGAAAQGHANDMLANNYFSHTGLDGSSVGDRVTAEGYVWTTVGENIARGQQSESDVMTAWTNSSGHHSNNINPNFEDFALAKAGTGSNQYWVLVLAAER